MIVDYIVTDSKTTRWIVKISDFRSVYYQQLFVTMSILKQREYMIQTQRKKTMSEVGGNLECWWLMQSRKTKRP